MKEKFIIDEDIEDTDEDIEDNNYYSKRKKSKLYIIYNTFNSMFYHKYNSDSINALQT